MLNPWYVTGFCDGEAVFTYSRIGGSFSLYFAVKQREDNRQIVEDIREFFQFVGKLYLNKASEPTKNSGNTREAVYYRVTKAEELKVILDHFDKFPLQSVKKFEAYKVWRAMVLHKIENYRRVDYNKLSLLAQSLSKLNLQSRAFKVHTR